MLLVRVLSLRMLLSAEVPRNYHIRHLFLGKTNACVVGDFVFASVLHPVPFFCNAELLSFCDLHDLAFRLAGRTMSNSLFARFLFRFSIGRNEASVFG